MPQIASHSSLMSRIKVKTGKSINSLNKNLMDDTG